MRTAVELPQSMRWAWVDLVQVVASGHRYRVPETGGGENVDVAVVYPSHDE